MTEPDAGDGRLTPVTAQTRAPERAHDTHDRLLVARHASGDRLESDEAAVLRSQLAVCAECAALVADLQLVQRAVATSTTVARPRDFQIGADQARRLRPNAWQRLLGRFSAPRMAALRPLAGATLAIGIVVLGVGAVAPGRVDSPSAESAPMVPDATSTADPVAQQLQFSTPSMDTMDTDPTHKGSFPLDGTGNTRERATGTSGSEMAALRSPEPTEDVTAVVAAPSPAPVSDGSDSVAAAPESAGGSQGWWLSVVGALLAAASLLVLVLTWLARRNADPLLR